VFKSIKELFSNSALNEPDDKQIQLAAATLMFELIRSDGNIDDAELSSLNNILISEFELSDEECQILTEQARQSAEDAISLQGFTRQICDHWGNEKRLQLLEYLWMLSLADKHIDRHERHLVRKVAGLLYLNDSEIVLAQEKAKLRLSH